MDGDIMMGLCESDRTGMPLAKKKTHLLQNLQMIPLDRAAFAWINLSYSIEDHTGSWK